MTHHNLYIPLFLCVALCACEKEEEKKPEVIRPVKTFQINKSEATMERSFPGKVEASEKADLSFRVSGKIIDFPVKEGDKVSKDQLIAKLDPKDYQIALDSAKAKAEYDQAQLKRYEELLKEDFVSKSKYEAQKSATEQSLAALNNAEKNLEYSELRAPFAGEIAARYVENHQTVKEKEPIIRLHDRSNIDITVQIPESIIVKARDTSKPAIEAEFDSVPGTKYQATIKEVSSKPDPDTQSYRVTVILPAPKNLNILPGMTATVYVGYNISTTQNDNAFLIPTSAIFGDDQGNSSVWIIDPKTSTVHKQNIKLGQLEGTQTPALEGLKPGETIVAAGVKFLREGMKVRPLETKGE